MSRIGRKPIAIPAGVEVTVENSVVTVKGPKGTMTQAVNPDPVSYTHLDVYKRQRRARSCSLCCSSASER